MASISRRRFVQAGSVASLVALAGVPVVGRAQTPIALRFSSSMTADDNAAHYVWYQRFQASLKAGVGDAIKIDYFPNNQLGKESDVVQQVKVGSIDMMVTGSSIWATAVSVSDGIFLLSLIYCSKLAFTVRIRASDS